MHFMQLTVFIWLVVFFHIAAVAFIHRRVAPTALYFRGVTLPHQSRAYCFVSEFSDNPLFVATFAGTAVASVITIFAIWWRLDSPRLQAQSAAPGSCLIVWWLGNARCLWSSLLWSFFVIVLVSCQRINSEARCKAACGYQQVKVPLFAWHWLP
jgi:hypothetical protein